MTVQLHHTEDGPAGAPALVLGSALGTTGAMWQPQMPALTPHFRVFRYDHRGHGKSPAPEGPYSIADMGRDLLALLDRLQLRRVHLGGLSLGGMVGMWVAAHAPSRVDRLALLCTSALLGPPSRWSERADAVRAGGMAAVADGVVARWFSPAFAATHAAVVGWASSMLLAAPVAGYAACCGAIQTMDLTGDLAAIEAPTLAVAGTLDEATPPSHLSLLASRIASARYTEVPAAHLANVEQPSLVGDLLLDFLS
jgi:3-oxoadipate enol-lactonase